MTFDEAHDAYCANPNIVTLARLFKTARVYEADGLIGDDTFQNVLALVEERLDWLAGYVEELL